MFGITTVCNHHFVEGFGGMGDAVVCCHCGLDKYPEAIPVLVAVSKLLGRYTRETDPEYEGLRWKAVLARSKEDARRSPG